MAWYLELGSPMTTSPSPLMSSNQVVNPVRLLNLPCYPINVEPTWSGNRLCCVMSTANQLYRILCTTNADMSTILHHIGAKAI
ncbi:hypothetical protein TMatcc_004419 [Talaromyces marneffei ATCC 18224]